MDRQALAHWLWRAAVLAALVWIGYSLHQIERQIPAGLDYEAEQAIRNIDRNTKDAAEWLRLSRPR